MDRLANYTKKPSSFLKVKEWVNSGGLCKLVPKLAGLPTTLTIQDGLVIALWFQPYDSKNMEFLPPSLLGKYPNSFLSKLPNRLELPGKTHIFGTLTLDCTTWKRINGKLHTDTIQNPFQAAITSVVAGYPDCAKPFRERLKFIAYDYKPVKSKSSSSQIKRWEYLLKTGLSCVSNPFGKAQGCKILTGDETEKECLDFIDTCQRDWNLTTRGAYFTKSVGNFSEWCYISRALLKA